MTDQLDAFTQLLGAKHVLTGTDAAPYGKDWTGKYTATPLAVLRPQHTDDVAQIVKIAAKRGLSIVPVGGNTGLVGGTKAEGAVMISLERLNRIREVRAAARLAVVEAGVILSDLHDAAEAEGLIFPLTFGARGSARIGGCLSTNAGGSNVVRYGSTRGLCLGLEVVLASGEVLDLMTELHKDNSGLDLRNLFIGAEGTLGIITAAVLKLAPKPTSYATAMVSCTGLPAALELLNTLQAASGGAVEAFEFMPKSYLDALARLRPDLPPLFAETPECSVMIELGATSAPLNDTLEDVLSAALEDGAVLDAVIAQNEQQRRGLWERREAAAEITFVKLPIVDSDICVPLDRVDQFMTQVTERLAKIDPDATDITVSHLGDGNVHYAVYPSRDDPAHLDAIREMVEDVTVELGGSISAEHGVGLSKISTLARRKSPVALDVMRTIKSSLDPQNMMNPGKVIPPL